ncbi:MAG: hypothetical protein GXN96_02930 [Aquificae bacterium]|nr:hypothetical protein [Aquificota bacterium]
MKTLLIFYRELHRSKEEVLRTVEENYRLIRKLLGIDNLYASITGEFLELFNRLPEACLINNIRGSINYGIYKGLRKLKGDDVLIVDGGRPLTRELLSRLVIGDRPSILVEEGRWLGLAYVPTKEIYYFIKSLERNLESCITEAFETLKSLYGIPYVKLEPVSATP